MLPITRLGLHHLRLWDLLPWIRLASDAMFEQLLLPRRHFGPLRYAGKAIRCNILVLFVKWQVSWPKLRTTRWRRRNTANCLKRPNIFSQVPAKSPPDWLTRSQFSMHAMTT